MLVVPLAVKPEIPEVGVANQVKFAPTTPEVMVIAVEVPPEQTD